MGRQALREALSPLDTGQHSDPYKKGFLRTKAVVSQEKVAWARSKQYDI